jgi:SPOR domain
MSYPLGSVESDQRAEFYAEPDDREARPRFRTWVAGLIALLVMGLFAGGLWLAYLQGARHASGGGGGDDVPLIRADARPTKMKPEKPGGMEIPDRDKLIYTQKHAAVEHLLPPPERPMPRPAASAISPAQPEAPPQLLAVSPPAPVPTPASSAAAVANQPSKTTATSTGAAKPASAQPSPSKAGGARIQLASVRSEEAAVQEWNRIKRANADLLGSLAATPVRADLGDKGVFYRLQTGVVTDADRVCRELNRRNVGCIIVR